MGEQNRGWNISYGNKFLDRKARDILFVSHPHTQERFVVSRKWDTAVDPATIEILKERWQAFGIVTERHAALSRLGNSLSTAAAGLKASRELPNAAMACRAICPSEITFALHCVTFLPWRRTIASTLTSPGFTGAIKETIRERIVCG